MTLSQKEFEVLTLIACGYSDKETANKLHLSVRTVQTYMIRVCLKLKARNRVNAAIKYLKRNPKWKISERFLK